MARTEISCEKWLRNTVEEVLDESPSENAITYPLNHWDGLTRALKDGRVRLNNNYVEPGEDTSQWAEGTGCSPDPMRARAGSQSSSPWCTATASLGSIQLSKAKMSWRRSPTSPHTAASAS